MLTVIRDILLLLTKKERWELFWLSVGMVAMAIVEVAGIASIMPFMAVVGNPEVVETNRWINWAYQKGRFASVDRFLIFLGLFVFFFIIASNVLKATTTWVQLNFINNRTYSLSRRLFFHYLTQPYTFYLDQNTQLLGKNLLQEVFHFINNVLKPVSAIFSMFIVILFIFGLLLFNDPILAFVIVTVLGGAYTALYYHVQKKLTELGEERFDANAQRFKVSSEALGGIKDLKLLGREPVFFNKFCFYAKRMARNMTSHQTISQLPRFVMEALSFGGILLIVIYFLMVKQDVGKTLPILALYAFAGYRLMPAFQTIFSSATTIRFNLAALDALKKELVGIEDVPANWSQSYLPALPFREKIQMDEITFFYPGVEEPVIKAVDLIIEKNTSVGFVGATGSGKTTMVDILLGFLQPQKGGVKIDGTPLTPENLPRWRRNLGYVPQTIFLCDDTIAGNIAFGVPAEEIDMAAVEKASRIANLHDFVINELPQGYFTEIGERGVRLSGGQRQRIGIARALYHSPEVLIMDEATSALDGITEEGVIHAIRNLAGKKTIITIAHRLTTLRDCDVIYIMEKGRITEHGIYEELSKTSTLFQAMDGRAGSSSVPPAPSR